MMNEYFVLLVDVCVAASYWCGYSLSVDEHGALKHCFSCLLFFKYYYYTD